MKLSIKEITSQRTASACATPLDTAKHPKNESYGLVDASQG